MKSLKKKLYLILTVITLSVNVVPIINSASRITHVPPCIDAENLTEGTRSIFH